MTDPATTCADCGAQFVAQGCTPGYATTSVPFAGGTYMVAAWDAEAVPPWPERRICYACSGKLHLATMRHRGSACLYLTQKHDQAGPCSEIRLGERWPFRWRISDWPGSIEFAPLGAVRTSKGFGFGRAYRVRTFRFVGPDGFIWSGRSAGDMDLARCRRTKERAR